jgi:Parkin co-regulated protein
MPPSLAAQLQLEDEFKAIVLHDRRFREKERKQGLLPKCPDSVFGNFPRITAPNLSKDTKKSAKLLTSLNSDPSPILLRKRSQFRLQSSHAPRIGTASGPKQAGGYARQAVKPSEFRKIYARGDLPFYQGSHGIHWRQSVESLDYHFILPIFVSGLREKEDPFRYFAVLGSFELVEKSPEKVAPVVPQLILPLRAALKTKDPEVVTVVVKFIKFMVIKDPKIAEYLVPYFRQILPVFNLFASSNINTGDKIYYGQRKELCLGDLIEETLEYLETYGGPDSYANIKYLVPTYQSILVNNK